MVQKLLMRRMRLLGLLVIAVLAAIVGGAGQSVAAPETTTPETSTPGTSTTPSPGTTPGSGMPLLDGILDQLAGGTGSDDGTGGAGAPGAGGPTSQMIVVTAPKASDTTATLTAFDLSLIHI